jgi:hypothetical protein
MIQYSYPTAASLLAIEADLMPSLMDDDPVLTEIFPEKRLDNDALIIQKRDNWLGLMQVRGMGGDPKIVATPGFKEVAITPGYYGEQRVISEQELTRRRRIGDPLARVDITALVREAQDFLLMRQIQRMRYEAWTLLTYGVYNALDISGAIVDSYQYNQRTFVSTVPWTTPATATPLLDLRNVQLQAAGYSVSFGPGAKAYMNQITANAIFQNTNNADIYGRRTQGLGTYNSPLQVNQLFMGDNLPEMVIMDGSYRDDNNNILRYIPSGYVIVVGKRPAGQTIGNYQMTLNANNADMSPGPYMFIKDTVGETVPRRIEIHRGVNGGPVLYFGSAVIVMKVF